MNFDLNFKTLQDFIYTREVDPSQKISFDHLSKLAHTSHNSITRRYRKFMAFRRSDNTSINKSRAKRCCNMVKKHLHDLKEIRSYLYQNNLQDKHPVFKNKINKWIKQCDGIYLRYTKHIKKL